MTNDPIIRMPGHSPEDDPHNAALLSEAQRQAALARTANDWMEIYIQIVNHEMKRIEQTGMGQQSDDTVMSRWRESRSRLKRIGERFTDAGLVLDERMGVEGCAPEAQGLRFETPRDPYVEFIWPDGSSILFRDEDAVSAMGFFIWWANFQTPLLGPEEGKSRILNPGDPEYDAYMRAKRRDQNQGSEPQ